MRAIATALRLLVLPAMALAQDEKPGDQERGRQIAERSCAGCLAIGPDGGSSKVAKATPSRRWPRTPMPATSGCSAGSTIWACWTSPRPPAATRRSPVSTVSRCAT